MVNIKQAAAAVAVGLVLALTACALSTEHTPTQQPDEFTVAWELCVEAHPALGEYADPDGEGHIEQTAEESCQRWMDNVGEQPFIEQWDQEFADIYRLAFGE